MLISFGIDQVIIPLERSLEALKSDGNVAEVLATLMKTFSTRSRGEQPTPSLIRHGHSDLVRSKSHTSVLAATDLLRSNIQFKIRLLALHLRHRLVILKDSMHIVEIMKDQNTKTDHSRLLIEELSKMTGDQAVENVEILSPIIEDCVSRSLKRLEVEMRLLQISFVVVASQMDHDYNFDCTASLDLVSSLCREYPETAGLFLEASRHVRRSLANPLSLRTHAIFTVAASDLWRHWGSHQIGHLVQCDLGHLYSAATFATCPECGRHVETPAPRTKPESPKQNAGSQAMQENAFVAKMKEMGLSIQMQMQAVLSDHDSSKPIMQQSTLGMQENAFLARMTDMGMICI